MRTEVRIAVEEELRVRLMLVVIELTQELGVTKICKEYKVPRSTFFSDPDIPWTNNRTEQAIGKMKLRAKTTRGHKIKTGMLNGLQMS